jgi:hypothetical protein
MATVPFPIPTSNSSGLTNSTGALRWNTTGNVMEVYTGTRWTPITDDQGWTWQRWFDYYCNISVDGQDRWSKRDYIEKEMQARYPGNYSVDQDGNKWVMVFDTPADETWFNLKYA